MPWDTKSKNRFPEMRPKQKVSKKYGRTPRVRIVKARSKIKRVDYDSIKPWKIKY